MISIIACVGQNLELGKGGDLAFTGRGELGYFKTTTMGHKVIMGYNTFVSLPGPLPGRECYVASHDPKVKLPQWATVVTDLTGFLEKYQKTPEEIFVIGGGSAYISTKESSSALNINHSISRGSTGRTQPLNLREQLAMEQVKSNPFAGTPLSKVPMNDSRWPASEGWIKMQQIVPTSQGNINIHYVYNQALKIFDDFKFNS